MYCCHLKVKYPHLHYFLLVVLWLFCRHIVCVYHKNLFKQLSTTIVFSELNLSGWVMLHIIYVCNTHIHAYAFLMMLDWTQPLYKGYRCILTDVHQMRLQWCYYTNDLNVLKKIYELESSDNSVISMYWVMMGSMRFYGC